MNREVASPYRDPACSHSTISQLHKQAGSILAERPTAATSAAPRRPHRALGGKGSRPPLRFPHPAPPPHPEDLETNNHNNAYWNELCIDYRRDTLKVRAGNHPIQLHLHSTDIRHEKHIAASSHHWLPDGVGTNGVFTEGPRMPIFVYYRVIRRLKVSRTYMSSYCSEVLGAISARRP